MSANDFQAIGAAGLQAAAALARYERHVRKLASTWLDMDQYAEVSAEIDDIKALCAVLPRVAVQWTDLLVSHAELIHALWRAAQDGSAAAGAEAQRKLEEHLGCIDALARRCLRIGDSARTGARFA